MCMLFLLFLLFDVTFVVMCSGGQRICRRKIRSLVLSAQMKLNDKQKMNVQEEENYKKKKIIGENNWRHINIAV